MSVSGAYRMPYGVRVCAILRLSLATAVLLWADAVFAQALPSAFTTGYRYSIGGKLTGIIRPDPDDAGPLLFPAVRNTYDTAGRLIRIEVGELLAWQPETISPASWTGFTVFRTQQYTYDSMGRQTSAQTLSGGTGYAYRQTSYDVVGRIECVAQRMNPSAFGSLPSSACALGPEGAGGPDRITRTIYDARDLPLTVQRAYGTPLQQTYATYTYSANGRPRTITDAKGNVSEMSYDGHDRLAQWNLPSPTTVGQVSSSDFEHYTYDDNGNRVTWRRRDGQTIGLSYDALDRMTLKDVPGGTAGDVYYGYDLRNLQIYARFGSDAGEGITTGYDGFGRVTLSSSNLGGATRNVSSAYDPNGNRIRVMHPDGAYFDYAYDGLDRLMHIAENGPSTTLASIFYDAQGRRSEAQRGNLVTTTTYGYDPISRLQSVAHNLDGSATGNDLTTTFLYNAASQIITRSSSNSTYHYSIVPAPTRTYSVNGLNQYSQIAGGGTVNPMWDAKGNLTYDGATTFGYDVENRLISASGAKNATLSYDPLGRLHQTTASSVTTGFVYDGDRLIAEYNGSGTLLRRYVHGSGIDEPLVWYEGSSVAAANRRYLHADHQGSIIAVAGTSGTTLAATAYDSYGTTGAPSAWRFQYTGQAAIGEVGLNYYKARFYNPTLGRFMQADPIGYEDDVNLYAYTGNDPVNLIDASGEKPGDPFLTAQAAAVDAIRYINNTSIAANREYGGNVYQKDGNYYAAEPKVDGPTHFALDPTDIPDGTRLYGDYHTHGDYSRYNDDGTVSRTFRGSDETDADDVSERDRIKSGMNWSKYRHYKGSWIGTPGGLIKFYDPATDTVGTIGKTPLYVGDRKVEDLPDARVPPPQGAVTIEPVCHRDDPC